MVDYERELLDSYKQLIAIQQSQLAIASLDSYDEQIEEIKELELQKLEPQAKINEIRLEEQLYSDIISKRQSEIAEYIQELQSSNHEMQLIFNSWYGEASNQMQQVSAHRKTLQSYGGVNYSDVISYYIDDRK